jgi:Flp pilus assembly pilin Flp
MSTAQWKSLVREDEGQDLIEYTLIMSFIVFVVAGLAGGLGASVAGITSLSNSQITAANTMVS